jgi:hypothetical protein
MCTVRYTLYSHCHEYYTVVTTIHTHTLNLSCLMLNRWSATVCSAVIRHVNPYCMVLMCMLLLIVKHIAGDSRLEQKAAILEVV